VRLLEESKAWALRVVVRLLAPKPVLGQVPGWRFGIGEEVPTLPLRLRKWLWERGRQLGHLWVRLPWLDGLVVETRLGTDLSRCLFVSGSYEPNEFAWLGTLLEPGMNVLDVGANEGLYALFAAQRVGAAGRVLAFEPSPREFHVLERNLALNGLSNVAVIRAAASDRDGAARLRIAEADHAGQSTLGQFAYPIDQVGNETVRLRRIDGVVDELALDAIHLMKVDVEGAEVAVLRGAWETLARDRPCLLIEVVDAALRGQGASREELAHILEQLGYQFFEFGPDGYPRKVEQLEVDGVNIAAVHESRAEALASVLTCGAVARS